MANGSACRVRVSFLEKENQERVSYERELKRKRELQRREIVAREREIEFREGIRRGETKQRAE